MRLEPILDWLFPTCCLCCNAEGEQLCAQCRGHVDAIGEQPRPPDGLSWVRCATLYRQPVSDAIQALKYGSASSLGPILGQLMASLLTPTIDDTRSAICAPLLIPVPIHRRRQRERGFNQAELLAAELAATFGWELRPDVLRRTRYTQPQAKLDRDKRLENLGGAFTVANPEATRGRNVVLVDDVLTTGSTLTACAVALQDSNPASIGALCLAYDQLA